MCGIFAILNQFNVKKYSLKHRGPDQHVEESFMEWDFIFDRLSINGLEDGQQPFKDATILETSVFMCNGEIYNHRELCSKHCVTPITKSDCEVVYRVLCGSQDDTSSFCASIDGEYAFVFKDKSRLIVARDRYGVRPLFYAVVNGTNGRQVVGFASEAKQLTEIPNVHSIEQFPPGEMWINFERIPFFKLLPSVRSDASFSEHVETVRTLLIRAVHKRLMSERPVGYFLSGGLDSSIIAAIGATLSKTPITTYSIGMKNSDSRDLIAARRVAEHLHSNHVEIQFDAKEAIDAIPEVIRTLESYDCTTIRASVPMYLLCKEISKQNHSKVMLSGEGADELFGGYLYLHGAPSLDAFQSETVSLLSHIHEFDGLRADRCTAAHGLELRVPFLDPSLVDYVVHMDPVHKAPVERVEKFVLRKAFESFLPKDIVYRQKNGMSDAVGSQWIDAIREHVRDVVRDVVQDASVLPPRHLVINTPKSDEEMWYRQQFQAMYPTVVSHQTIWRPKWTTETDPSARKLPTFVGQ